ncbi:MAG: phosphoenolpyruvate synthase [Lachnospiraceae bacterium]|nr:phosphoenolpyruvate synthase [Lachnospiraceae bacterium]
MYIKSFSEIHKDDIPVAGGKGANLGEMTGAGINIPAGFVITADAYRLFISENGYEDIFADTLQEAGNDEQKLTAASARLRDIILEGAIPEAVMAELRDKYNDLCREGAVRVAVRSSATAEDLAEASFAGQQETYLGIRGLEEVTEAVRKCYASLWGTRATIYRNNLGFDQADVALAVVIQTMVASEKAGVLFTVDPIENDTDAMRINSSFGLGESVVSGRVTADSILVSKNGKILSYDCGSKLTRIIYDDNYTKEVPVAPELQNAPSLSEKEIEKLCHEGALIENHYGKPMDIEWAVCGDRVYILQARPITTIKSKSTDDEAALIQSYIANSRISGADRGNMAFQLEKMPYAYRPLDYDLIMKINDQKANIFAEAGIILTSDPQIDDDGIMTLPDPHKALSKNIFKFPSVFKEVKNFEHCAKVCEDFMPKYEKELDAYAEIDYESLDVGGCASILERSYDLLGRLCYDRFKYALFPSAIAGDLTKAVKKIDRKYTNYDLYRGLDNKTAVVTRDVAALAEVISQDEALSAAILSGADFAALTADHPVFADLIKEFMDKNGFKSDFNCYCIEARTFIEDPDRLINILRPLIGLDSEPAATDTLSYEDMLSRLKEIYKSNYPKLERKIAAFRTFHLVREESQYLWEKLFFYIRKALKRLNMLLMGNDDHIHGISNLFYKELITACNRGFLDESDREKIDRRNNKHPLSQKVWDASKLLVFDTAGDTLKGVSGSTGVAVGNVCVIHSPAEFHKMKSGDILVCELTDPEWTPLFSLAAGVVADTGSSLSHAAIVAREFGIPAVLGVGFATAKFKDGDMIRVDGDKGIVSAC